ncbi:hypothetical protein T439DRAFT_353208 [Meredithblackwellia eburnea MCA 4105]
MVRILQTLALLTSVFVSLANGQAMQIVTPPALVQCQPAAITWTGGVAPYFVSVIPGGEVSGIPLKSFDSTTSTTITWTDSTGALAYSAPVTIQAGTTTSCSSTTTGAEARAGNSTSSTSAVGSSSSSSGVGSTTSNAVGTSTSSSSAGTGTTSKPATTGATTASTGAPASETTTKAGAAGTVAVNSFFALGLAAVVALAA